MIENPVSTSYKGRKIWIDGLRGLAMVFVLYGHLVNDWSTYYVFTSPIKIPLFFANTGYVYKTREGDFKRFLKNLCFNAGSSMGVSVFNACKDTISPN